MKNMIVILVIILVGNTLIAQDNYLDERASLICERIAASERPVSELGMYGGLELLRTKGLDQINLSLAHQKEMKASYGLEDHLYSAYFNLYIAQKCPDFVDLQRSFDTRYVQNKRQRNRYMKLYELVRDLLMTDAVASTSEYYSVSSKARIVNDLNAIHLSLKEQRFKTTLNIYPEMRRDDVFYLQLIDIRDHKRVTQFIIKFDNQDLIYNMKVNQYTTGLPEEIIEEPVEMVPVGRG